MATRNVRRSMPARIAGHARPGRPAGRVRLGIVALVAAAALPLLAAPAEAQRRGGGGQRYEEPGDNPRYDGRYTFVRLRYEMGIDGGMFRGRGLPPWAHDYPRGERNFTKILAELTTIRTRSHESVVLALDDPELLKYPVSYMSEPGFWRPTDREVAAFGTYLRKGGFVIFDDFREYDWNNLEAQMKRVLPEARFLRIDGTHPIFDSFYRINDPESLTSYGRLQPTYWAIFEDNDPTKRMIAIADRDNDISEYWEWSDTGIYAVDLSNEAYKIGINYLVYALSR